MAKDLVELFANSDGLPQYYQGYVDYLSHAMKQLDGQDLEAVIDLFLTARKEDKTLYFAGNGGSAATASHFSQDLAEVGRKANVPGFRTMSLTDNVSYITAAGNDYGYESIFTTQMQYTFNPGDLLTVISASGNSPSVVEAAKLALKKGGKVIAMVGFDGGELAKIATQVLNISSNKGEYGPVEDGHMMLDHILTSYLTFRLKSLKA
jgi:D-sedoheptulose 7-phosphate isomerase